jgi:carbon monoxide dehydrogenase subunit G
MVIERSFHIAAPPDAVWALIKDVPRVLPHIPGAQLIESMSNGAHTAGVTLHRAHCGRAHHSGRRRGSRRR